MTSSPFKWSVLPERVAAVAVNAEPDRDEQSRPPWWTEADDAELAALTWELVDGVYEHWEMQCASCARVRAREIAVCPHITEAIAVVVDWHHARNLRSYARWIRLQLDLIELEQDILVHRSRGRL